MHFDLRQLRQFIAIVESGSFRRAAKILHIAQPALSVSIQKLERAVGMKLLERLPKGVAITAAGQALVTDARRSVFHADQARISARRVALGEFGELRLGFVGSATYAVLPQRLPRFRARYPHIQLSLREETTLRLVEMLHANDLDAALVRGPLTDDRDISAHVVETDDLVLSVPMIHMLAQKRRVRLRDLHSECFVMYSRREVPGLFHLTQGLCQQAGFSPHISQHAIQVQTVISLVASGMGVALVPRAARAYPNPHVRFIDLADRETKGALSLSLVVLSHGANPAAQHLRETMLEAN